MSAAEALKAARAAGVRLGIEGDALTLEAATAPPPTVLDLLARHKAAILALLRPAHDGWSRDDWFTYFDERAGIAEFEGGLPRREAEVRAFDCCVAEWLNRNPVSAPPGHCVGCGQTEHSYDPLLPFGIESSGHVRLHSRCWPAWLASRKAEAVAALAKLRIPALRTH